MIKWNPTYSKLVLYSILIIIAAYLMPVEKNWSKSFSNKHDWPYGGKVMQDVLSDLFPDNNITTTKLPMYNTLDELDVDSNYLLVTIDISVYFDSLELSAMLQFVDRGNAAFISSYYKGYNLIDTLHIESENMYTSLDAIFNVEKGFLESDEKHTFINSQDSSFIFSIISAEEYYSVIDTMPSGMIPIEIIKDSSVYSFVRVPYGNGYFYLHNQPLLFTNYYLLKDEGKRYVETLTSYLPDAHIIWDENHKEINNNFRDSPLHIILKEPSLKWAYWISILALFLIFLFRIKRRQRIIPTIDPPVNDSLEFTKTMGSLYYNTSTNREVAKKKIIVFKEFLNREFYMNDITFNAEDVDVIVNKTNHSKEQVEKLFSLIAAVDRTENVSGGQLKILNKMINKFLNKKV